MVAAAIVLLLGALTACSEDDPEAPMLTMPQLVGKPVGQAVSATYDALHTSLVSYDLSPADRKSAMDWVVVGTDPKAGEPTPMYTKVYAWVLKASEYQWFQRHPTMPDLPARIEVEKLVAKGGLLEPVKDLVQVRYVAGRAPATAEPSPVDAAAFTPDRGLYPDLATEPPGEFNARAGLLAAPKKGMVAVASRPGAENKLRVGQYLVVLVDKKPKPKPKPPSTPAPPTSAATGPTGSSGGGRGGSGGSGGGIKLPGLPSGFPTKIPGCPKRLCG